MSRVTLIKSIQKNQNKNKNARAVYCTIFEILLAYKVCHDLDNYE